MIRKINNIAFLFLASLIAVSCSTTKKIPEGDQLFIGLTDIKYNNYEKNSHAEKTKEEVEAALATAPNGALFGSSYYRTPFPYGLWIWNAFSGSNGHVAKWITKSFGKKPVLMSWVNPTLRASVAQSVLRNHGYFRASVGYETFTQKNPKKAKIGYNVDMSHLFTIDTIEYVNFPANADSLLSASSDNRLLHSGDAFDVAALDAERTRITKLFRNNGYYYYQSRYASYLADTVAIPGKVKLRLQLADSIPAAVSRKWYIGKVNIEMRKKFMEQLNDSFSNRFFSVHFNGRRPPIRTRVIMSDMKLRPRSLYNYENYLESANKINSTGLFSTVDFRFTPRDTTAKCDTLDLTLSCVFNKPYDFYIETNVTNRTSGRFGPELVLGFAKRNAFRGGEKLDVNLHGSYEWETNGGNSKMNSYEYGLDTSLEFPRLVAPFMGGNRPRRDKKTQRRRRMRYYTTPTTLAKLSFNVLNRPNYFKMHTTSAEWTYKWQRTATSRHEFSPLMLKYQYLNRTTNAFDSILTENPYLSTTMQNMFIPKMRYYYKYVSPKTYRNPIYWDFTVTEAGNILSLGYMAAGKKWGEKDKKMFKDAYAQFLKLETDFTKTWQLSTSSQLLAHVSAGAIFTYGNSSQAPYSEQFYVGGANSIRAFTVRTIGPGSYMVPGDSKLSYIDQTGDLKLVFNLEYRKRLFGSVYGAVFIDAGNIWTLKDDGYRNGSKFRFKNLLDETALGTGIGLRYDLDFLVLRLDWGVGLHLPYDTGKSGYFNIGKFKDCHSLHLAVGYPF